jgi:uncharacterized protein YdaU (DUF1376 family)
MSLPYYKRFPRDFLDKTIGMTLEQKGAYGIVLDLIYMRDGRLPDDVQYLAGQLGCSVRKWKTIRSELVSMGKLTIENGMISNSRADKLLEETRIFREKQAENRAHPNKNSAVQSPKPDHLDLDTEVEETEAKASVSAPVLVSLEQIAGKSRKPKPPQPAPDLQPALDAYNRLAERLRAEHGKAVWPVVTTFTAKRQAALRARIKEHGLEAWGTVLRKAYASPLCTGLRNSWAADFNFLTSPEGFLKTLEGNYDDRASANGSASRHSGSNGGRLEAFDRLADKLQERSDGPDAWQHDDSGAEGGDIIDIGPAQLTG